MIKLILEYNDLKQFADLVKRQIRELADPRLSLEMIREETILDVDSQFDEKQFEWTPLAEYTVRKKTEGQKDLRILHETKEEGDRLRDAYATQSAEIKGDEMTYSYPPSKPYAKDHQTGKDYGKKKKDRESRLDRMERLLDEEYESRLQRD